MKKYLKIVLAWLNFTSSQMQYHKITFFQSFYTKPKLYSYQANIIIKEYNGLFVKNYTIKLIKIYYK